MTALDDPTTSANPGDSARRVPRWLIGLGALAAAAILFLAGVAVSRGSAPAQPKMLAVPSVVGLTFQQAENQLRQQGFQAVTFAPTDAVRESARVVVQKPSAGTVVNPSQPIGVEALAAQPGFDFSSLLGSSSTSPNYSGSTSYGSYGSGSYSSTPSTTSAGPVSASQISASTYMVGSGEGELPPGTYVGKCTGSLSSWARYGSGGTDDLDGYDSIYSAGQLVVTVKSSDTSVKFTGSCNWSKR